MFVKEQNYNGFVEFMENFSCSSTISKENEEWYLIVKNDIFQDLDDKAELNENVGLRALNYDIVFTSEQVAESGDDAPIVLIPRNFPIPVRKSYHLPSGSDSISVKVFLRASNQEMNELIQVSTNHTCWES